MAQSISHGVHQRPSFFAIDETMEGIDDALGNQSYSLMAMKVGFCHNEYMHNILFVVRPDIVLNAG